MFEVTTTSFDVFSEMNLALGGLVGLQIDPALYTSKVMLQGKQLIRAEVFSDERNRRYKSIEDTTFDGFNIAIEEAHIKLPQIETANAPVQAEYERAQEKVQISVNCIKERERVQSDIDF